MIEYSVRDAGFMGRMFEFNVGPFHLFGTWGGSRFAYRWQLCIGNHHCFPLLPKRLTTFLLIRAVRRQKGR